VGLGVSLWLVGLVGGDWVGASFPVGHAD
jgi:hypothetical protein